MLKALQEFTQFMRWMQHSTRRLPNLWTKLIGLNHKPTCRLPVNYTQFTIPHRVEGWVYLGHQIFVSELWDILQLKGVRLLIYLSGSSILHRFTTVSGFIILDKIGGKCDRFCSFTYLLVCWFMHRITRKVVDGFGLNFFVWVLNDFGLLSLLGTGLTKGQFFGQQFDPGWRCNSATKFISITRQDKVKVIRGSNPSLPQGGGASAQENFVYLRSLRSSHCTKSY